MVSTYIPFLTHARVCIGPATMNTLNPCYWGVIFRVLNSTCRIQDTLIRAYSGILTPYCQIPCSPGPVNPGLHHFEHLFGPRDLRLHHSWTPSWAVPELDLSTYDTHPPYSRYIVLYIGICIHMRTICHHHVICAVWELATTCHPMHHRYHIWAERGVHIEPFMISSWAGSEYMYRYI